MVCGCVAAEGYPRAGTAARVAAACAAGPALRPDPCHVALLDISMDGRYSKATPSGSGAIVPARARKVERFGLRSLDVPPRTCYHKDVRCEGRGRHPFDTWHAHDA